jgi:hypothetical protein
VFDPINLFWTPTGSMLEPRHDHIAALVRVGGAVRVLVAGGTRCTGATCTVLSSAELWNPATGTWSATGSMTQPRSGHAGSALPGCQTLVAGGETTGGSTLASAELYDQITGTWSVTAPMAAARKHAQATVRLNGSVVLSGGIGTGSPPDLASAESFSPCPVACGTSVPSCACPSCADSDQDGLSDVWETSGIDTDCNGVVDLSLPALGANPQRKDIFMEMDYMEGGSPPHSDAFSPAWIQTVVDSFADAPVPNPDGSTGITLHVDVDDAIPHFEHAGNDVDPNCPGDAHFPVMKFLHFEASRAPAFHYAISAHNGNCAGGNVAGLAEQPGNDILFTGALYSLDPTWRANMLMHELGHNLSLRHGAFGTTNHPNYISIMNLAFSNGIPPTFRVDYSREELPDLEESALEESLGVQGGTDQTYYRCGAGSTPVLAPGTGPIDWDCDNVIDTAPVQADINGDGQVSLLQFIGFADWEVSTSPFPDLVPPAVNLHFQCSRAYFEEGPSAGLAEEPGLDELRRLNLLHPLLLVGIDLRPGCEANAVQPDSPDDVPVAVFGSPSLDVTQIDASTVRLASAPAHRDVALQDLNADGRQDAILRFPMDDMVVAPQTTSVLLLGALLSSQAIQGQTPVAVVQSLADFDADCVPDDIDSCPTIPNLGEDRDQDEVDEACDNCRDLPNPPFTGSTANRHRTGGGTGGFGQLDDDVDGRGNRCDFDYNQAAIAVGAPDTALMVTALGPPAKNISQNDCGPSGTSACGIHDNNENAAGIGAPDSALLFALLGGPPGTTNLNNSPNRHCGVTPAQTCGANPNQACCSPFSRPLGGPVIPPTLGKAICLNATGAGAPQRCVYAN